MAEVDPCAGNNGELQFKLLAEISARFVGVPAREVDQQIEDALRKICEFHQIDHASLWQASEAPDVLLLTHVFRDPSLRPRPDRMTGGESFPWAQSKVLRKEIVCVPDVRDVPPEAATDLQTWRQYSVRATLGIPLSIGGGPVFGVVSFESTRNPRTWPTDLIEQLKYLAHIFVSALDRKRSEEMLRASEARLSLAAASANAGLWTLDPVSGRVWATNQGLALFGFPPDFQPTIEIFLDRVCPVDREKVRTTIEEGMRTGGEVSVEYRIQLPDQSIRWISSRGRRQSGTLREPDRLMGVSIDITEAKRVEHEMTKLRERLQAETEYLQEEVRTHNSFDEIVGHDKQLKAVFRRIEQVANTDATVLITGETGTGKELVARSIHSLSRRKDRVMVKIDCSSLPGSLIESEMFGREKGAYTGALSKQIGRFELASGSTVFLDEVGELPLELQAKLLRVLQDGHLERLGSPKTINVDVRVIAATNRNLADCIKEGSFRQDLYYRLNVFPIHLPPLRERSADIPVLTWAFVRELERKLGRKIESISKKTMEALQAYHWPGNIRELRNVVEQAIIVSNGNQLEVQMPETREMVTLPTLRGAEHRHILSVLESTGWRIKGSGGAAELLGLKPSTLYTTMQRLGIPTKQQKDGIPT
jgi:transcriptional regulator with GAF, ATPase, and Fis domain